MPMINKSVIMYKGNEYSGDWISSAIIHTKNILENFCKNSNLALCFCDPLKYSIAVLASLHLNVKVYLLHPDAPEEKIQYLTERNITIVYDKHIDLTNIEIKNYNVNLESSCSFIFSTSCTTSNKIKWVEIPSKTLLIKSYMLNNVLNIKKTDCTYIVSPMCFIQTIWSLLIHLISSSEIWIDDFSLDNLKNAFSKNTITTLVTVPSIAQTICNTVHKKTSLRLLVLGGDCASKDLICSLKNLNDSLLLSNIYGCTETSAADIILSPTKITDNGKVKFSLGKPSYFSQINLIDEHGNIVEKNNEIAQICIKGKYVAKQYHNSDIAICDENGFKTGDFAYRDENGYYYFVGRKSTIIKYNGQKIYALEIENALMQVDGILEAVVYGKDDEKYGQIANAVIVTKGNISKARIVKAIEKKLEKYKIPKNFYSVDSIPKTSTGKSIRNNQTYDELKKIIIE